MIVLCPWLSVNVSISNGLVDLENNFTIFRQDRIVLVKALVYDVLGLFCFQFLSVGGSKCSLETLSV